jgi:hypothetical protein
MKAYKSLFRLYREQPMETVFAHFYPIDGDWDEPFKIVAAHTFDGVDAWSFQQPRFRAKHPSTQLPKLRNYLNYTFVRLLDLESEHPGEYFMQSADGAWICFNTGLQTPHGSDLLAIFQRYLPRVGGEQKPAADWVFKGCYAPNDRQYRDRFGTTFPDIAWYSTDSRDFTYDLSYHLDRDVFDHLFDQAKDRAGLSNSSDEVIRNYLHGALENLVPKIKRSYKIAVPVYYVEEKRMQLLLPFASASNANDVSAFLVERDDKDKVYKPKTVFDLDAAYFSARLITRPDREWLNP